MSDWRLSRRGLWVGDRWLPCVIGRGAIRLEKLEGDGATPAGIHRIVGMLYRPDRVAQPQPWAEPILPGDLWSDAPESAQYNQAVRAPYGKSHEVLRRPDPLYDIVFITDYNYPKAVPGHGSAIFLHQWRRPGYPTEGCVAFSRAHVFWLAKQVQLGTRLNIPETLSV